MYICMRCSPSPKKPLFRSACLAVRNLMLSPRVCNISKSHPIPNFRIGSLCTAVHIINFLPGGSIYLSPPPPNILRNLSERRGPLPLISKNDIATGRLVTSSFLFLIVSCQSWVLGKQKRASSSPQHLIMIAFGRRGGKNSSLIGLSGVVRGTAAANAFEDYQHELRIIRACKASGSPPVRHPLMVMMMMVMVSIKHSVGLGLRCG